MIFLQRHGESEANLSGIYACKTIDPDLTESGKKEAEESAAFFAGIEIHRIMSSPSKRALQTARIIGGRLNRAVEIDSRLIEVDVGDFEGHSYDSRQFSWERCLAVFQEWLVEKKDSSFSGGEACCAGYSSGCSGNFDKGAYLDR